MRRTQVARSRTEPCPSLAPRTSFTDDGATAAAAAAAADDVDDVDDCRQLVVRKRRQTVVN